MRQAANWMPVAIQRSQRSPRTAGWSYRMDVSRNYLEKSSVNLQILQTVCSTGTDKMVSSPFPHESNTALHTVFIFRSISQTCSCSPVRSWRSWRTRALYQWDRGTVLQERPTASWSVFNFYVWAFLILSSCCLLRCPALVGWWRSGQTKTSSTTGIPEGHERAKPPQQGKVRGKDETCGGETQGIACVHW